MTDGGAIIAITGEIAACAQGFPSNVKLTSSARDILNTRARASDGFGNISKLHIIFLQLSSDCFLAFSKMSESISSFKRFTSIASSLDISKVS